MVALMKGKVWSEHKHKMTYPCIAEVKYDEIRVHVVRVHDSIQFLSYAGKPLLNLSAFAPAFSLLMQNNFLTALDCGVEVNGTFADSYRYVRSKSVPADLVQAPIKFYLFDLPDLGAYTYAERVARRYSVCSDAINVNLKLYAPEQYTCTNEAAVDALFIKVRERGFEGLMVKSLRHLYHSVPARTDGWLKLKPEAEADGKIISFHEAVSLEGTPLGRIGSIGVALEDGSFATPAGIGHALGEQMFKHPDQYLHHWVEFKFMERDRAGGYRHPSFTRFREDKV